MLKMELESVSASVLLEYRWVLVLESECGWATVLVLQPGFLSVSASVLLE